jgi:hypothetical protein
MHVHCACLTGQNRNVDRRKFATIGSLLKKGTDPLRHNEYRGENARFQRVCPLFQQAVSAPCRTNVARALRRKYFAAGEPTRSLFVMKRALPRAANNHMFERVARCDLPRSIGDYTARRVLHCASGVSPRARERRRRATGAAGSRARRLRIERASRRRGFPDGTAFGNSFSPGKQNSPVGAGDRAHRTKRPPLGFPLVCLKQHRMLATRRSECRVVFNQEGRQKNLSDVPPARLWQFLPVAASLTPLVRSRCRAIP